MNSVEEGDGNRPKSGDQQLARAFPGRRSTEIVQCGSFGGPSCRLIEARPRRKERAGPTGPTGPKSGGWKETLILEAPFRGSTGLGERVKMGRPSCRYKALAPEMG